MENNSTLDWLLLLIQFTTENILAESSSISLVPSHIAETTSLVIYFSLKSNPQQKRALLANNVYMWTHLFKQMPRIFWAVKLARGEPMAIKRMGEARVIKHQKVYECMYKRGRFQEF